MVKVQEIKYGVIYENNAYRFETEHEFKDWCRQYLYASRPKFWDKIDEYEPKDDVNGR